MSAPGHLGAGIGRRARWLRALARRRALDGRLPPSTVELVRGAVGTVARDRLRVAVAAATPAPRSRTGRRRARVVPGEWRRRIVTGPLRTPATELAHLAADAVVPRLRSAGPEPHPIEPFLIAVHDDGDVHLGLPLAARRDAFAAVRGLPRADGWYLTTQRGDRTRTRLLHARRSALAARRAHTWRIFRWYAAGDGAIGRDHAVRLSFWEPAEPARWERVGERGRHRFDPATASTVETVAGRAYRGRSCFPVQRALTRLDQPIDAVITWVDGADPVWRAQMQHWHRREMTAGRATNDSPSGGVEAHRGRFESHDELRYLLRSLWLHAGWLRRIYVVTADQRPPWLREDDRLRLVAHREILPEAVLPTFNSHAIEARLHHIDGLAEHFVYFNDDVLLGRPVDATRFFTPNGLPRFFESEALVPASPSPGRLDEAALRNERALVEREFGRSVRHRLQHAPFALRRSVLSEIEKRFPDEIAATVGHRFRHPSDIPVASALAHHYGAATGRAVPGELAVVHENLGGRRLRLALARLGVARDADSICVNETEVWEVPQERAIARFTGFLEGYFPVPSPWEAT